jgi:hypothetical protein
VVLGAGGFGVVNASISNGDRAIYMPIAPIRVLDTRSSAKVVDSTLRLVVEGVITVAYGTSQQVVPMDASAVAINVTVTSTRKNAGYGFVTIFPCVSNRDTVPDASSLNFEDGVDIANALNVATSSNGSICLYVHGSADLLVDVTGYYADHNHDDRYYSKSEMDTTLATIANTGTPGAKGDTGAPGPKGDTGAPGPKGDTGAPGTNGTNGTDGTNGTNGTDGTDGASSPTGFTARSVCGASGTTLCAVGVQGPGGGTIVYVDSTNEMPGYDYLEVAPTDAEIDIEWSTTTAKCGTATTNNCRTAFLSDASTALDYLGLGTGRAATARIIARHNAGQVAKSLYAAGVADAYTTPTASDWFLPSRDELNEVCKYATNTGQAAGAGAVCVGGEIRSDFSAGTLFWSSSEFNGTSALNQWFVSGSQGGASKDNPYFVRPVRAF